VFDWKFFNHPEDAAPVRAIDLDSACNRQRGRRSPHVWLKEESLPANSMPIAWTALTNQNKGHRFNFKKLLLDPFATAISQLPPWDFASALGYDPVRPPGKDLTPSKLDNAGTMPKCVFVNDPCQLAGDTAAPASGGRTEARSFMKRMCAAVYHVIPKSGVNHPGT